MRGGSQLNSKCTPSLPREGNELITREPYALYGLIQSRCHETLPPCEKDISFREMCATGALVGTHSMGGGGAAREAARPVAAARAALKGSV